MGKKVNAINVNCDTDTYLFTSESVTMGHPDKVADCISDAILDAMLAQDPKSRVACETMVTTGLAVIAGEITSKAVVDIPDVVRETIKKIGYTDPTIGFDYENCAVNVAIDKAVRIVFSGLEMSTPDPVKLYTAQTVTVSYRVTGRDGAGAIQTEDFALNPEDGFVDSADHSVLALFGVGAVVL